MIRHAFAACVALALPPLALPNLAVAGDLDAVVGEPLVHAPSVAPGAVAAGGNTLVFTLRGGIASTPVYSGSDERALGPDLGFSFGFLRFGGTEFGTADPNAINNGIGFRGSFRYIAGRSADDYPELSGLADVDQTIELGGGVTWTQPGYQAYADLRYGVIGHESIVGEAGVDLYLRPSDRLTLRAGPRVLWGADDYAATYYGVTAAEAGASAFSAYEATGGVMSTGVEVGLAYEFDDRWGLDAAIRYDQLQGSAAESPITTSDDQVSARIGITRRFDFRF